jgi:protein tyrosine phosphatase
MSFVRVLTCANDALKKHSEKLMIVHCSAGIGRSGTFITVDVILQQMLEAQKRETGLEWNVMGVVRDLRRVRAGMVQMKSQYMFLYEVLLAEAEKIKF